MEEARPQLEADAGLTGVVLRRLNSAWPSSGSELMRGRSDEVVAVQRGVDPKHDGNAPGVRGGEAE